MIFSAPHPPRANKIVECVEGRKEGRKEGRGFSFHDISLLLFLYGPLMPPWRTCHLETPNVRKSGDKHPKKQTNTQTHTPRPLAFSMGKYSSSPQAVMEAGTLGFGLVVEMQKAIPASLRATKTCSSPHTHNSAHEHFTLYGLLIKIHL